MFSPFSPEADLGQCMARRNSESSESVESTGARALAARANVMSIDWFVKGPRVLSVPYILDLVGFGWHR